MHNRCQSDEYCMNSGLQIVEAYGNAAVRPDWPQQFQNWRDLVGDCLRKPNKGRVHALRVATLRLSAEVDHWRGGRDADDAAHGVAKRWSRNAKKLRRVLSDVREADVHLSRLAALETSLTFDTGYLPRSTRIALRQLGGLQRWLKQARRRAAKRLVENLACRLERLERVSREIESTVSWQSSISTSPNAREVFEMFQSIVREFPSLDADRLHDFRKQIKNVRYQAELFAHTDPEVKRLAASLKAMQVATGEWHDLHALAQLASRRFRKRTKSDGLAELLDELTEESLQRARELCEKHLMQLSADESAGKTTQKLPVCSDEPLHRTEERRLA